MYNDSMTLLEWRRANKKTQLWVTLTTGISQALLSKYERGTTRPGVENVRKIEKATSGGVTLNDWYPVNKNEGNQ
jgi:transcriptional regulator with XRE-family HTH domain